jgi:hypothetical protein
VASVAGTREVRKRKEVEGNVLGLEGSRKSRQVLNHNKQSPGKELNPADPEYEAGILFNWPQSLVQRF